MEEGARILWPADGCGTEREVERRSVLVHCVSSVKTAWYPSSPNTYVIQMQARLRESDLSRISISIDRTGCNDRYPV